MNIHRFLATLIATPALTWHQSSLAQNSQPDLNQKLALYAKPAVVRIVSQCSGTYLWKGSKSYPNQRFDSNLDFIGTGFFINPDGYIVTSAGVLEDEQDCKDRIYDNVSQSIQNKYNFDNPLSRKEVQKQGDLKVSFSPGVVILPNANAKILPFDVKKLGRALGRDVAIIKVPLINAPTLLLGDSSQVQLQDNFITIGYPITADINLEQTESLYEPYEPSVTKGSITNPSETLKDGYPILVVDIPFLADIVGSPLISDQGKVIGMLASSDSTKGATISFAIPTSTILEFIRQSGAVNERGPTDQYYRDGLDLLGKGNYEEAKGNFLKVKQLFPLHSEVDKLISVIDEILADQYVKPWKNPTYQLLLGLIIIIGGFILIASFLWQKIKQITHLLWSQIKQRLSGLNHKLNGIISIIIIIIEKLPKLSEQPISDNLIKARAEEIWKARIEKGLHNENPDVDWYAAIDSLKPWHSRLKLRLKITAKKIWLWSGISDKKGWDLLTVISLPLVLFFGAQYLTWNSANEQKKIADRRYRQELLENYFNKISELIFTKNQNEKTRTVIRAKTLTDANLTGANLKKTKLNRANFKDANLTRADLTGADLTGASLTGASLTRANLTRADLTGVNLTGAKLSNADLTEAKGTQAGANFTRFTTADLTGANLTKANLRGADLTDADLTGANLTNANLAGANFKDANLTGANLTNANLTGATLTSDQIKQARNPPETLQK